MGCLIDEMSVAKVQRTGARCVKPGVAAPHADQVHAADIYRPPERRKIRRQSGKGRTDRIVAAGAVFLDAAKRLLVAGIDRRRAAAGQQNDERVRQLPFVGQLARDARDVVIADEGERHERIQPGIMPIKRPAEFKEIAIVQRAPDSLPELVLGDRIDPPSREQSRHSHRG